MIALEGVALNIWITIYEIAQYWWILYIVIFAISV